jgi:tRNA A-37 threonylcarbamoyl transferase component Bud32
MYIETQVRRSSLFRFPSYLSFAEVRMLNSLSLEELIISIAKSLYKVKPKITRYSTRDRSVWGLEFDGDTVDRVIKLDLNRATSLKREQKVMQILTNEGIPIPDIEFTQEDLPDVWIPFTIMPKVVDRTSLLTVYNNHRELMLESCRKTGELLAKLHQISLDKMQIDPSFLLAAEGWGENLTAADIDWRQLNNCLAYIRDLTEEIQNKKYILQALNQLKKIVREQEVQAVTHRDFAPNQILINEREIFAIDWEAAAAGRIYRDLGDFIAALRRVTEDERYSHAFINSYCDIKPLSAEEISEIGLWEVFSMVRKSRLNSVAKKPNMAQRLIQLATEKTVASQLLSVC